MSMPMHLSIHVSHHSPERQDAVLAAIRAFTEKEGLTRELRRPFKAQDPQGRPHIFLSTHRAYPVEISGSGKWPETAAAQLAEAVKEANGGVRCVAQLQAMYSRHADGDDEGREMLRRGVRVLLRPGVSAHFPAPASAEAVISALDEVRARDWTPYYYEVMDGRVLVSGDAEQARADREAAGRSEADILAAWSSIPAELDVGTWAYIDDYANLICMSDRGGFAKSYLKLPGTSRSVALTALEGAFEEMEARNDYSGARGVFIRATKPARRFPFVLSILRESPTV